MNLLRISTKGSVGRVAAYCTLVVILSWTWSSARAQVLDEVPPDALVVVKIKNLSQTSTKIAALAQQFGLSLLAPEMQDPLGSFQTKSNMKAGLDTAGDAALIMPNNDLKGEQPPLVVLVPITDYKAFIGNFGADVKEGDLDQVEMKWDGGVAQKTYMANWGKYAAISDNKAYLTKPPAGLKLGAAVTKELDSRDVVVYVNMKILGPKVLPDFDANKDKYLDMVESEMTKAPGFDAKYAPVMKAYMGQYAAGARQFLQSAQSATYGMNFSNEGITVSGMVDFDPTSYIGGIVKGVRNTDASLLKGLPDAKYIWCGGLTINNPTLPKVLDDAVAPVVAAYAKTGADPKTLNALIADVRQCLSLEKQGSFAVIAPTGALGNSSLVQIVSIVEGDSKKLLDLQKLTTEAASEFFKSLGNPMFKMDSVFTPNAKTIDGVSLNSVAQKFATDGQTPEAQQLEQMFKMAYGPDGSLVYSGAVDDSHVVMAVGVDDATLGDLVKSSKANDESLSKDAQIVAIAKNLPTNRAFVGYFALDTLAGTVLNYMRQVGLAIPVNIPPNLPPIGMTISTDGAAVTLNEYIPSKLVSGLVSAGMQAFMNHGQQQPKPAGPGGL